MDEIKIIFLDIDGVLNSNEHKLYCNDIGKYVVNKRVEMIRELCESNNVHIVITSSWRQSNLDGTLKEFEQYDDLKTLIPYIVGITPRLNNKIRGEEIQWFIDHRNYPPMEPYNNFYKFEFFFKKKRFKFIYCIIDDDSDMLSEQMNNLVCTYNNISFGLEEPDIVKIKNILNI